MAPPPRARIIPPATQAKEDPQNRGKACRNSEQGRCGERGVRSPHFFSLACLSRRSPILGTTWNRLDRHVVHQRTLYLNSAAGVNAASEEGCQSNP